MNFVIILALVGVFCGKKSMFDKIQIHTNDDVFFLPMTEYLKNISDLKCVHTLLCIISSISTFFVINFFQLRAAKTSVCFYFCLPSSPENTKKPV